MSGAPQKKEKTVGTDFVNKLANIYVLQPKHQISRILNDELRYLFTRQQNDRA